MPKQNPLPLLLGADWVTFLGQLSILPLIILSSWVWTCTAQLTNWLKSQIIHARLMIPLDGCDPTGWMWSHRSLDLMGAHVCGTSEHPACLRSHGAVRSEVRHSVCVCVCQGWGRKDSWGGECPTSCTATWVQKARSVPSFPRMQVALWHSFAVFSFVLLSRLLGYVAWALWYIPRVLVLPFPSV